MQNYEINVMAAAPLPPLPPPGTERSIRNIFHSAAPQAVRRSNGREGGEAGFETLKCKISQVQEVAGGGEW